MKKETVFIMENTIGQLHIWDRQGKDPVFLKSRFLKIRMTESF